VSECTVEVTPLLLGDPHVALPPTVAFHYHCETISVGALIQRVVIQQIQALQERNRHSQGEIRQILARQYLTEQELSEQATHGAIKMPTPVAQNHQTPDIQQEVQRALAGFEQGRFFITVNGFQPDTLEQQLLLSEHTEVLFLRLTPLVGG